MCLKNNEPVFTFRPCNQADLEEIMALQDKILAGIPDPELFAPTSREENSSLMISPNQIIGVYAEEKLIAYGSVFFPFRSGKNLGRDLGIPEEELDACVTLDTIVVDPDFRGYHLQRRLIRRCVSYVKEVQPACRVLTTICPKNKYSLRNAQAEKFEIMMQLKKYGGRDRYILEYNSSLSD